MDLTTIFCQVDDFCKEYVKQAQEVLLPCADWKPSRRSMSLSEILTVLIYYGACSEDFKTFKSFYKYNKVELKSAFPGLLSYGRITELKEEVQHPMIMFLLSQLAPCDGKNWADSTRLEACHIKRENSHKVLQGIAAKGKTGYGWFYGTKLHLILNEYSEIVTLRLTKGNVADNNNELIRGFAKHVWGILFGDKGYIINPKLWEELYSAGLKVVHNIRANMKGKLMPEQEKILLGKRANICEGTYSKLKDRSSLQYTRNRSIYGFLSNVMIMLIAYQLWARERATRLKQVALEIAESLSDPSLKNALAATY